MTKDPHRSTDNAFRESFWHPSPVRSIARIKELAGELNPSIQSLQAAIRSWLVPGWPDGTHPFLPAGQVGHLVAAYLRHEKPVRALEMSSAYYPFLMEALAGNDVGALHWVSLEKGHADDLQEKVASARWFLQMESLEGLHPKRRFPIVLAGPKRGSSLAFDRRMLRHGIPTLRKAAEFLEEGGTLIWVTTSYAFTGLGHRPQSRGSDIAESLEPTGLRIRAIVELQSTRLYPNTSGEAVMVILDKRSDASPENVFVAQLPLDRLWESDALAAAAESLWQAFRENRPAEKGGLFRWVEPDDWCRFSDLQAQAELAALLPRGEVNLVRLQRLVIKWQRGSWDIGPPGENDLFIPHDERGCVAESIDATGVGRTTCFRVTLNTKRCNKHYMLRVLNSAYGRRMRRYATNTERIAPSNLAGMMIPLPSLADQERLGAEWVEVTRMKAELDRRLDDLQPLA